MDLEPHPVSGELELDEVRSIKYRRLDRETIQAKLDVNQFGIMPVYVWCDKDDHGGTEPGWKLADLRTSEDNEDDAEWSEQQEEADKEFDSHTATVPQSSVKNQAAQEEDDDDDDDYWNAYDKTEEERTPAEPSAAAGAKTTDADYYSRYGQEVQPAMDSHDPDEAGGEIGSSTLNGESLLGAGSTRATSSQNIAQQADYLRSLQPHGNWKPHDSAFQTTLEQSVNGEQELSMPRPISPAPSGSSVDKLEERAAKMSTRSNSSDRAQLSIQQHISTDIKSLFRLAKANGMSRADFSDIVSRELDVLSILDDE